MSIIMERRFAGTAYLLSHDPSSLLKKLLMMSPAVLSTLAHLLQQGLWAVLCTDSGTASVIVLQYKTDGCGPVQDGDF